MNRTSIQLADGSGDYLAAVDVYHHLHCVVSCPLVPALCYSDDGSENDPPIPTPGILQYGRIADGR